MPRVKGTGRGVDQGSREWVGDPVTNIAFRPSSKGGPTKNLYTNSDRLTVSCRVTLAWAERVNWYNRQIMILLIKAKTLAI
jgi:hypothetical protein